MRKTITTVALSLALACSPLAFAGTAAAATPAVPASVDSAVTGCTNYTLKLVNGRWTLVPTTTGCTTSSTGTGGTSGGTGGGTSTPGTYTNNCVPASSCTGSATGTGGRTR